jgi:hypothetical protein
MTLLEAVLGSDGTTTTNETCIQKGAQDVLVISL